MLPERSAVVIRTVQERNGESDSVIDPKREQQSWLSCKTQAICPQEQQQQKSEVDHDSFEPMLLVCTEPINLKVAQS